MQKQNLCGVLNRNFDLSIFKEDIGGRSKVAGGIYALSATFDPPPDPVAVCNCRI